MPTYQTRSITYHPHGCLENAFTIHCLPWVSCAPLLNEIRVAASERKIISHVEALPDARDPIAHHAIAVDADGRVIACGRLIPDGHVERIAVLPHEHQGLIRTALVEALLDLAR